MYTTFLSILLYTYNNREQHITTVDSICNDQIKQVEICVEVILE